MFDNIHGTYLCSVIDRESRKSVIRRMVKLIKDSKVQFDAIAFRGASGALIAPIIADRLNKKLIMVRKEHSHSWCEVEGDKLGKTYIIIDDCVESGETIRAMVSKLHKEYHFRHYKCVGVFLYLHCNREAKSSIVDITKMLGAPVHGFFSQENFTVYYDQWGNFSVNE
jgi:adenine/guanine phosphoribosyltransferase-like PRPP-binding protein